jgi:hypothetical protein
LPSSKDLKKILINFYRDSAEIFQFGRMEIIFNFSMSTDEGINERLYCKIILEIENPVIREWDYRIDINLKTTDNIAIEWLILWIGNSFVNGYFGLFAYPISLSDDLVTDVVLFLCIGVFYVGHVSLLLAVYASDVLIYHLILALFLYVLLVETHEVDLVRESSI